MEEEEMNETCSSGAKHFEWQLNSGGQWQNIENDHVIETHYCHPGAKGITINTTSGKLFINFDTLRTDNPFTSVLRRSFLSSGQTEDVGWFFRGDCLWTEFGSQSPDGSKSSISSRDVEQHFRLNPTGSLRFTVGAVGYSLDFSTMTQTNLVTSMTRKVRRRPKYPAPTGLSAASAVAPPPQLLAPPPGPAPPLQLLAPPPGPAPPQVRWEFLGDEGVWTEYQPHVCSYSSADIETAFQADRQGQLTFTARRHSYTLDFTGMFQINNVFQTKRTVRRTQHTSSSAAPTLPRWQFQDVDGQWKDFVQGNGGCSVSSQDIELRYQQNPSGSLDFATRQFNYELNFAAMTQTNASTNTRRPIRRLNH